MIIFFRHPLFWLGIALRGIAIIAFEPPAAADWYVPFVEASLSSPTLDPWALWAQNGGTIEAFPYGYGMWVALLPLLLVAKLLGLPSTFAYEISLLVFDFLLLLVLGRLMKEREEKLFRYYWLSPIVLFATYVLGLNDVVPAFFLVAAVLSLSEARFQQAGIWLGLAVSAKLSMVVAVPIAFIFVIAARRRRFAPGFFISFVGVSSILWLPFIASPAATSFLVGNQDVSSILDLAINTTNNSKLYLAPLLYTMLIYFVWRLPQLNNALLRAILGFTFLVLVLMNPASVGWFVWSIPFLVTYQISSDRLTRQIFTAFSLMFAVATLSSEVLRFSTGLEWNLVDFAVLGEEVEGQLVAITHTAMVSIGVIVAIRLWREAIGRSDFVRITKKPISIGVAGDSGAGKDTLVSALIGVFGSGAVTKVSGDDYHLWDRNRQEWGYVTHLNPAANDLRALHHDVLNLLDGKKILRRGYDHETGKFGKPESLKPEPVVIVSGLHTFSHENLRKLLDLKIFLEVDEELRTFFKLRRDCVERGHSREAVLQSISRRVEDGKRFISPQAAQADILFKIAPLNTRWKLVSIDNSTPELKLTARVVDGPQIENLARVLISQLDLKVDIERDNAMARISIEGRVSSDDVELAVELLCPEMKDLFALSPCWNGGVVGLMQLIVNYQLWNILQGRRLS